MALSQAPTRPLPVPLPLPLPLSCRVLCARVPHFMRFMHFFFSAVQLEVAIDTIAKVDQAGYRPLHWLLFGKALLVGTGHVSPVHSSTHVAFIAPHPSTA